MKTFEDSIIIKEKSHEFSLISEKLRQLKLAGMLKEFENHQHNTLYDTLSFADRLSLLLTAELNDKEKQK